MRKTWRTPRVERPNFAKEHREVCPATRFLISCPLSGMKWWAVFPLLSRSPTRGGPITWECGAAPV